MLVEALKNVLQRTNLVKEQHEANLVNIAEAGEHPPGAGGAQVGQAAGGPTAQWAVHSTRPKCQVTSTTMPKAMRYQAKGTKSWLEM